MDSFDSFAEHTKRWIRSGSSLLVSCSHLNFEFRFFGRLLASSTTDVLAFGADRSSEVVIKLVGATINTAEPAHPDAPIVIGFKLCFDSGIEVFIFELDIDFPLVG